MNIEELNNQVKAFVSKVTTTGQLIDHLKDVQSSYEQVLASFEIINTDKKNVNIIAEAIKEKIIKLTDDVQHIHQQHLKTLTGLKEAILQSHASHIDQLKVHVAEFSTTQQQALKQLETFMETIRDLITTEQNEFKILFQENLASLTTTQTEIKELKQSVQHQSDTILELKSEILSLKLEQTNQFNSITTSQQTILDKISALHHRIENPPKKKFLGLF